jgi:hypothetical protein
MLDHIVEVWFFVTYDTIKHISLTANVLIKSIMFLLWGIYSSPGNWGISTEERTPSGERGKESREWRWWVRFSLLLWVPWQCPTPVRSSTIHLNHSSHVIKLPALSSNYRAQLINLRKRILHYRHTLTGSETFSIKACFTQCMNGFNEIWVQTPTRLFLDVS